MHKKSFLAGVLATALILGGCAYFLSDKTAEIADAPQQDRAIVETLSLERANFEDLETLDQSYQQGFMDAVTRSCRTMIRRDHAASYGPTALGGNVNDWVAPCQAALNREDIAPQAWLKTYFTPYIVYDDGDTEGLFTGYYEPLLHGSIEKTDRYNVPLYVMPEDLIQVDLGAFAEDLKGRLIWGRINPQGRRLVPYDDRAAIDAGVIEGRVPELVWVDSAIDAFFLHIQGSGMVRFENGDEMRVGYAGQNGHRYFAIGKELIDRGAIARENVSLQTIRAWLEQNPDQAAEVMQLNPSYIFFHALENTDGPLGAQGVALTPNISLAVDRRLYPYGMPVLLRAQDPLDTSQKIDHLMVAQDTGGAIRGAVRGDVFWGAGDVAEEKAGHMKSKGRYWIFLPNTITPPEEFMRDVKTLPAQQRKTKSRIFFWQ